MRDDLRNASFRIGDFVVDPRRNRVLGAGGEVSLQPKAIEVLCTLAEHHGDVLSRAELIDQVWGKDSAPTRA